MTGLGLEAGPPRLAERPPDLRPVMNPTPPTPTLFRCRVVTLDRPRSEWAGGKNAFARARCCTPWAPRGVRVPQGVRSSSADAFRLHPPRKPGLTEEKKVDRADPRPARFPSSPCDVRALAEAGPGDPGRGCEKPRCPPLLVAGGLTEAP
jgi:hypothetical protein